MLFVNYNDGEWIRKFISEMLTEDDFIEIINSESGRMVLADKLGYTRVANTYVFHNEHGNIEEDFNLEKLSSKIERNDLYNSRIFETMKSMVRIKTAPVSDERLNDLKTECKELQIENRQLEEKVKAYQTELEKFHNTQCDYGLQAKTKKLEEQLAESQRMCIEFQAKNKKLEEQVALARRLCNLIEESQWRPYYGF